MLTPAHPPRQDPAYQARLHQRRRDLEDKDEHPENWGLVRPGTAPEPNAARDSPREPARDDTRRG